MPSRRKQVTYSQRPNHAARSAHARGERQFRTYDTSHIRPKSRKAPIIFTIVLAVAVIGLLVWGATTLFSGYFNQQAVLLEQGQEATVIVEDGSGAQTVGKTLVEARLVATASEFTDRVNELGVASKLKPGTYTFVGGMSLDDIIKALEAGPVGNGLTIPEGTTIAQIAKLVSEFTGGRISVGDFTEAASDASVYAADYDFLSDAGTNSLEGFLFPKTYEIDDEDTADSIIRMMISQFQIETADLDWEYTQSQGLTVYDAVKLASIVEKESSGDETIRAQVAAVFYNRLRNLGDPNYGFLQSDATKAYEVKREPTAADIATASPYNTYTNTGLPPTPICSPGIDCLKAVCSPAANYSEYFFFSFWPNSQGDTDYFFDKTYDEHMATIAEHS